MGKPNVVTKRYMQDNARFADVCNFFLFNGRQVICPENLVKQDVTELALPKGLNNLEAIEKVRDILKGCCVKSADGITYLIIGIENQNDMHYAMVVRNMLYDAMNYTSQAEEHARQHRKNKDVSGAEFLSGFSKTDKLVPVVTLTIFWNTGSWDGARSLHEMLEVKEKSILDFVSDYKLNLIVPEEIKDFEKFQTEVGPLLEFISYANSGKKLAKALQEKGSQWENMSSEAIDLLNVCINAKLKVNVTEKGVGNMCKGIDELVEMGEERGGLRMLLQLVRDGLISLSVGAERANISEQDFKKFLEGQCEIDSIF